MREANIVNSGIEIKTDRMRLTRATVLGEKDLQAAVNNSPLRDSPARSVVEIVRGASDAIGAHSAQVRVTPYLSMMSDTSSVDDVAANMGLTLERARERLVERDEKLDNIINEQLEIQAQIAANRGGSLSDFFPTNASPN